MDGIILITKHKSAIHLLKNPVHFLSLGLGSGLLPKMPGTWGSLLALFLFYPFSGLSVPILGIIIALLFFMGIYCCHQTAKVLKKADPSEVVLDEIVAMFFILATVPVSIPLYFFAFVVFRVFDILKPWPIRWCDKNIQAGLGIMLDDMLAAGYSVILIYLMRMYII